MKNIHVRLEFEEALEGKKELLSSQANVLEVLRKLKNYKNLRRQELILKNNLKKEFFALRHEINKINDAFPKQEAGEMPRIKKRTLKTAETKHDKNIEFQLQEIKEKLAKLS